MAAEAHDDARVDDLISGHQAIISGLMGLDDEHDDGAEIHPVHLFALQINKQRNPDDDAWGFFVRNWGNEGYCSSFYHVLNQDTITLRLRRPSGLPSSARAVFLPSTTMSLMSVGDAPPPEIRSQPGTDAIVVFHLPLPTKECMRLSAPQLLNGSQPNCGLIAGELHLAWVDPLLREVTQALIVGRGYRGES
jgi:hypothetical protein